jgi:hypothetical protein
MGVVGAADAAVRLWKGSVEYRHQHPRRRRDPVTDPKASSRGVGEFSPGSTPERADDLARAIDADRRGEDRQIDTGSAER